MLEEETEKSLRKPLDSERIRSREASFGPVYYLPAHDVIRRANEIFGYEGWSGRIVDLQKEFQERDGEQWTVLYRCSYEVRAGDRTHQDVGVGTGIRDNLGDAVENAIKSAVSDAIKRALRAWGDQFGLSLYADEGAASREGAEELTLDHIRNLIDGNRESWPAEKVEASATRKQLTKLKSFWKSQLGNSEEELIEFLRNVTGREISELDQLNRAEASGVLDVVFHRTEDLRELVGKGATD